MSKDLNQRIRDASFGNAGPAIETSVDFREAIHDQCPIGKPESTNWIRISPMDPAPWARHEAALRAELIRLEQSHPIATSPKLRQLLRYLFAETVAGRGEQLSQYGIAFDCYMLGDRYDSASNTLVRTHTRRLRRILNELAPANGSARILMRERGYQLVQATSRFGCRFSGFLNLKSCPQRMFRSICAGPLRQN